MSALQHNQVTWIDFFNKSFFMTTILSFHPVFVSNLFACLNLILLFLIYILFIVYLLFVYLFNYCLLVL